MLREVGFAANHFIEMAMLQELHVLYPDQHIRYIHHYRHQNTSTLRGCKSAVMFVQALRGPTGAVVDAITPVGLAGAVDETKLQQLLSEAERIGRPDLVAMS